MNSGCLVAGGKCRNGKWLCFTLYFFRVSIFSLSGHCVHHYWSITAMYNTETNFYTRVKLNLILFFFFFSPIILLFVTLYLKLWKNIVEYSHFRKDVRVKPFFFIYQRKRFQHMYRNLILITFFLLPVRKIRFSLNYCT